MLTLQFHNSFAKSGSHNISVVWETEDRAAFWLVTDISPVRILYSHVLDMFSSTIWHVEQHQLHTVHITPRFITYCIFIPLYAFKLKLAVTWMVISGNKSATICQIILPKYSNTNVKTLISNNNSSYTVQINIDTIYKCICIQILNMNTPPPTHTHTVTEHRHPELGYSVWTLKATVTSLTHQWVALHEQ